MSNLSLAEFADKIGDIMPAISKEFLRNQTVEFYKAKITLPQCVILDILDKSGESNMSDLAKNINVTTAAITGLVDRLVRDNYVIRFSDPDDRRVIKIKPTAKGEKVVKALRKHRREVVIKLFGVLSAREREEYLRLLTRIKDGIKS
jgi:DNA-binding MarR family transcriptional regulator